MSGAALMLEAVKGEYLTTGTCVVCQQCQVCYDAFCTDKTSAWRLDWSVQNSKVEWAL